MEDSKSNNEMLNQRLKNRERQRRYRAKKRQEADSTNADTSMTETRAFILVQEAQKEEAQKQLSQVTVIDPSHIYCKRKWKRDARLAHRSNQPASGSSYSTNSHVGLSHELEVSRLLLHLRGESPCNNSSSLSETETKTSVPIRRKWKADARNKTK